MQAAATSPMWVEVDDRDALIQVELLLVQLVAALAEERAAVARLDAAALDTLAAEKTRIADALTAIAEAQGLENREVAVRNSDPALELIRERAKATASQVRADARANAILLTEALHAVTDALGIGGEPTGYDRRARRVSRYQAHGGRNF